MFWACVVIAGVVGLFIYVSNDSGDNDPILLQNESNGLTAECPSGFSWTMLLFGFFVPVIRGWYGYAAISLLVSILTAGVGWLIYPFLVNKHYLKYRIESGYKPISGMDVQRVKDAGIGYNII